MTISTKTNDLVAEGSYADLTPTATKSGWTFVGWNTDKDATTALTELEFIDEQHQTNYKRNKVDAYGSLWGMLATDVTEEFLNKFRNIFVFVTNEDDEYLYEEA